MINLKILIMCSLHNTITNTIQVGSQNSNTRKTINGLKVNGNHIIMNGNEKTIINDNDITISDNKPVKGDKVFKNIENDINGNEMNKNGIDDDDNDLYKDGVEKDLHGYDKMASGCMKEPKLEDPDKKELLVCPILSFGGGSNGGGNLNKGGGIFFWS